MGVTVRCWTAGAAVALWISVLLFMPTTTASAEQYRLAGVTFIGSQVAKHESTVGAPAARDETLAGHDVSGHQGDVDWDGAWAGDARFVYIKATEGTGYINPHFAQQYNGSYRVGMIRGAYHFARPDVSSGADQANYFVDHGGNWSPDGRTLPGVLDIEYNPYGDTCYGLDPVAMSWWLRDFSDTYRDRTGRYPMIYTSTSWWNRCTGANPDFAAHNPLWVARYNTEVGELPAGWTRQRIWQFAAAGKLPGNQDTFNGSLSELRQFARRR